MEKGDKKTENVETMTKTKRKTTRKRKKKKNSGLIWMKEESRFVVWVKQREKEKTKETERGTSKAIQEGRAKERV